jgi:sodium/hydrogen antiporter
LGHPEGFAGGYSANSNHRKWIDGESYVLLPAALGLFIIGTCGATGLDDLLACTLSGAFLNWDGEFLAETERRHDEVNSCIDVLLNFGGFMYIGTIINWSDFHDPDGTGITIWRLLLLGIMVLFLRRIPAILALYKLMPRVVSNWREALFMGYFGPIGIGAVFYVEHTRHLIPVQGEGDAEYENLLRALTPTVHFLVVFSIIVHGLSIPALDLIYKHMGVKPIQEDPVSIHRRSMSIATPANAIYDGGDNNFIAYNRFSRPTNAIPRETRDALAALENGNRSSFDRTSTASWTDDVELEKRDKPRAIRYEV